MKHKIRINSVYETETGVIGQKMRPMTGVMFSTNKDNVVRGIFLEGHNLNKGQILQGIKKSIKDLPPKHELENQTFEVNTEEE